jgi:hypothetical protein
MLPDALPVHGLLHNSKVGLCFFEDGGWNGLQTKTPKKMTEQEVVLTVLVFMWTVLAWIGIRQRIIDKRKEVLHNSDDNP